MNDQVNLNEEHYEEQRTDAAGEQPEETVELEEVVQAKPQENSEHKNFRELREARDRASRERDDAVRRLQEYETRSSTHQAQPYEEEDDLSIDADSLVEGKHLKTVNKKIKQLEKSLQHATTTAIENSLRAKFSDFDTVVSQDNITLLRDMYPEVAQVISSSPDLYSKSVAAYNFIKSQGLHNHKNYDQDREQAQRNANKPRPLISTKNSSPLSQVNDFAKTHMTEEYKDRIYKEMLELASRA